VCWRFDLVQIPMQAEKNFLRHFLGGGPVAQEVERDGEHGGLMLPHQRPEIVTGFHRLGQHTYFSSFSKAIWLLTSA